MKRGVLLLFGLLLAVFLVQGCYHAAEDEAVVYVRGLAFEPRDLEVSAGTTVVWVNDSGFDHTATATDESWDSGAMADGNEFRYTFDEPGEYEYYCAFHIDEGMTGTIVVTE